MRFALRNQEKIAAAHGEDFVRRLISLLVAYQSSGEYKEYECGQYTCIDVPSDEAPGETIRFAVVGGKYDVKQVAYYPKEEK